MFFAAEKLNEWAGVLENYIGSKDPVAVLGACRGIGYMMGDTGNKARDERERELLGQGLFFDDNAPKDEITLYSIFRDVPSSAVIWDALAWAITYQDGTNRFADIYAAANQMAGEGRAKKITLVALSNTLEKDNPKKNVFHIDALYVICKALGFKAVASPATQTISNKVMGGGSETLSDFLEAVDSDVEYMLATSRRLEDYINEDYDVSFTDEELAQINMFTIDRLQTSAKINDKPELKSLRSMYEHMRSHLVGAVSEAGRYRPLSDILRFCKATQEYVDKTVEWIDGIDAKNAGTYELDKVKAALAESDMLIATAAEHKETTQYFPNAAYKERALKALNALNPSINKLQPIAKKAKEVLERELKIKNFNTDKARYEEILNDACAFAEQFDTVEFPHIRCKADARGVLEKVQLRLDNLKEAQEKLKKYDASIGKADLSGVAACSSSLRACAEKTQEILLDITVPETVAKDVTGVTDEGRVYSTDGVEVLFSLMKEDYSELLFDEGSGDETVGLYDYSAYHNLVDAAVDVRKQPIFSDYGDITVYPYFKPFKYQVDSVRTMLSRFEGRGIFGDQVGLGKTPQALMTADVMFRCGTIRNVVIVAGDPIIRQWRREASTKFRNENGESMFELYPRVDRESDIGNKKRAKNQPIAYTFDQLIKELEADKDTVRPEALKVYFLSTSKILKNASARKQIKASNEAARLDIVANKPFDVSELDSDFVSLTADISSEDCIAKLKAIATKLVYEYGENSTRDKSIGSMISKGFIKKYMWSITGNEGDGWDPAREWKFAEDEKMADLIPAGKDSVFGELSRYNKKLSQIKARIIEIEKRLEESRKDNLYNKQRLIDLLIFDEVQDLLTNLNEKKAKAGEDAEDKKSSAALVQDFIAGVQKKYCVLISATPIRNDLSDIFNLLYMVDKGRLGDTREEAENRFYNGYCGGCRSLSDMANSDNPKKKFQILNGLINSMFTRKRLYDKDVIESLRRQCSTPAEIEAAAAHGRDEYGGARFMTLARAISAVYRNEENNNGTLSGDDYTEALSYKEALFRAHYPTEELYAQEMSDEQYYGYLKGILECITESAYIEIERIKVETRTELRRGIKIDICGRFAEEYETLTRLESRKDKESAREAAATKVKCDLLCSYINRGLLDYYRTPHEYKTTFIAEYIDWRRPEKRGVKVKVSSEAEKIELFGRILPVTKEEPTSSAIGSEDIATLQQGKVLFFEKSVKPRSAIYRAIRKAPPAFGEQRRVYVNLNRSAVEDGGYTVEELLDLGYFAMGAMKEECRALHKKIKAKKTRTFEEERYITTWSEDGAIIDTAEDDDEQSVAPETKFNGLNFKWFSEFTVDNGNWNSVYFMDKTQIAGTDLNAANILVIGQLDSGTQYLDPLDMEQLIGRISRTGQTERCTVYTCLFNGRDKTERNAGVANDADFNEVYYGLLEDKEGFDLFGRCQTEIDFVVPVVMACARRLFSEEYSYTAKQLGGSQFTKDSSDFRAVYADENIKKNAVQKLRTVEKFPQMAKFAYDRRNDITVHFRNEDGGIERMDPVEAIRRLVRIYAKVLSHEAEQND